MARRVDGGSVDICMHTHMNGYVGKQQWIQVIRRQISYRINKQTAHFQMSYVNTTDGVVSIKKRSNIQSTEYHMTSTREVGWMKSKTSYDEESGK